MTSILFLLYYKTHVSNHLLVLIHAKNELQAIEKAYKLLPEIVAVEGCQRVL